MVTREPRGRPVDLLVGGRRLLPVRGSKGKMCWWRWGYRREREAPAGDRRGLEREHGVPGSGVARPALRGMNPSRLAIADDVFGLREALNRVFPETRLQRCWVHKERNIRSHISKPKRAPKGPRAMPCSTSGTPRAATAPWLPGSRNSSRSSATSTPRRPSACSTWWHHRHFTNG